MAIKWAVANGSWSDGTIWNDGVVPTSGDFVYCNGHNVNANTSVNIGNGTITNDANSELGIVSGGAFLLSVQNLSHSANFQSSVGRIITLSQQGCVINGNLTGGSGSKGFIYRNTTSAVVSGITINGNISLSAGYLTETYPVTTLTVTINGSFESSTETAFYSSYTSNVNVLYLYGRIIIRGSLTNRPITSLTISGEFDGYANSQTITTFTMLSGTEPSVCTMHNSTRLACTTMNVSGILRYDSSLHNTLGYTWTTLNITDNTKFGWVDIADDETKLNPFRIITNDNFDYPLESDVVAGTHYAFGELVGTYLPDYPPESVVLKDFVFDNGDKVGSLENQNIVGCVTKEDVREGVPLIGMYEDEQQVVGTIIIPAEENVREGVHYDNDKIGTLIVQGGGDRLRIADFGYYTNAQSDTYIVDITEADKPKFASAEERILIEMFPELDLNNIPEMYFDKMFVKFLKYRLIVEYYRTAGVNSTFTPSEPTTEIVNYRNVTCEVWLNSANTYLNAWNKKFGLNKPPKKVRL